VNKFDDITGGTYLWPWKGGVAGGVATDAKYNIMPIPSSDMSANPTLVQNDGYSYLQTVILVKKIVNISLLLGLVIFLSCEKDETKAYLDPTPGTPDITSPTTGTTKVLTNADSAVAVSFTWLAADYGFPSEIVYALQMDKAGSNFAEPVGIATVTSATTAGLITYEFNNKLLSMGLNYGEESTIEIRVRSILTGTSNPDKSNMLSVSG